jgi:anti-sigma B factor antagonist
MTSQKTNWRQIGNVSVLDMDGNIRIGDSSVALREAIRELLAEGKNQILLNLARVGYIDSLGLGELISIHITLKKNGGQIKLLHLTQRLRELMTITKLLTVFDVYEDEAEALDSFRKSDLETTSPPQPFLVAVH